MMQGVAILLMLFLHLFNDETRVETLCSNYLTIFGKPLVYYLTWAANPVPFYLILSGYGLSCVFQTDKLSPLGQVRRLSRLYFFHILTILIFVGIGSIVRPDKYPGSVSEFLLNITSWSSSYSAERWFLLPYALVSLSSLYLFRIKEKLGIWTTLAVTFFISLVTGFLISRYGEAFFYHHVWAILPILYAQFLFPFYLGDALHKMAQKRGSLQTSRSALKMSAPALLILLIALKSMSPHHYWNVPYTAVFILLFLNCPRPRFINVFLIEMGRLSMIMWFIHTYFSNYLFRDFIFSPHHPLLIFFLLLLCSYISAFIIDWVGQPIYQRMAKKWLC